MHREWDFEADEQRPVKQSFCGSLRRDAHLKCFILTFLIAGCLAAIFWCRLTVVRRLEDSLSSSSASLASSVASHSYFTFPASGDSSRSSEAHYSPCNDGYVYIPVAFVIMLYLVYLVECWHSHTRIELQYKVDINSVYDKVRDMREGLPIIWWKAICYHYVRRTRQVTRYRNGDAFTSTQVYYERVNTCTAGSAFNFTQCGVKDISKLLYGLENYPATKIRFSKGFSFVNVESESEFEDQRSQFFQEYESRDDYMEGREGMDILNVNFKEYMIAFADPDNLPWYVSHIMFWIASFLLLSWPLRVIIEYKTAHLHYHVHKLFGTNYADADLYRLGTLSRVSTMTSAELDMNTRNNNVMVPSYSEALLMNTVQFCSSSARSGTGRRDSKILCGLSTRRDLRPMSGGKVSRSLFALSTWTEPRCALGLSTSRSFANTATPPNPAITFVPGSMPSITLTTVRQFNTINNYDKLSEGAPATRNDYRDKLFVHEIPTPTSFGIIRDNTNNNFTNDGVFNLRGDRGNVRKTSPLSYSHFSGFGPDPVSVSGADPVSDNGIISAKTAVPLNKNLESFALALDSLCTSTDTQTGSVKTQINLTGTRTKSRVVTHFHGDDRVTTPTRSDPLAGNMYSLDHVLHINGPEYLSSTVVHGLFTYKSQRSIESVSPLYTEAPPTYNEALSMPTALKCDRQGPRNSRQKCSSDDEGTAPPLHYSPSLKLYQRAHPAHLLCLNSGYKERRPELNCGCQEWRPERVIQRESSGLGGYRDVTCTKNSSYSLPKGQPQNSQIFPLKTTARVPKSISLRDFQNCCMPSTSICNKKVIAVSKILQNKSYEPVAAYPIIPRKRLVSMPTNECHDEQKKTCKQSGAISPLFSDFPSHVELKDNTKSMHDEDCDTGCILGGNGDSGNVRDGIKHNIRCRIGDIFGRDQVSNVLLPLPSVTLPEHHLNYNNVGVRRKVRIYKSFTQSHLAQLTSTQQLTSSTQQLTSSTQQLSSYTRAQLTSCTQALPSNQAHLCCNQKQLSEDSRADSLPKEKHIVRVNHRPHTNQSTVTNIRLISPSTAQRCYGSVNCMETSL